MSLALVLVCFAIGITASVVGDRRDPEGADARRAGLEARAPPDGRRLVLRGSWSGSSSVLEVVVVVGRYRAARARVDLRTSKRSTISSRPLSSIGTSSPRRTQSPPAATRPRTARRRARRVLVDDEDLGLGVEVRPRPGEEVVDLEAADRGAGSNLTGRDGSQTIGSCAARLALASGTSLRRPAAPGLARRRSLRATTSWRTSSAEPRSATGARSRPPRPRRPAAPRPGGAALVARLSSWRILGLALGGATAGEARRLAAVLSSWSDSRRGRSARTAAARR